MGWTGFERFRRSQSGCHARLGVTQHLTDNARVFGVKLDVDDLSMIEPVLARSRDLITLIGDCGDEYRS
jgi:hypothetical protein